MARHKIVPRRKKNSKSESLEQRIGLIQRFHHTLATKLLPTTPTFIAQEQYQPPISAGAQCSTRSPAAAQI